MKRILALCVMAMLAACAVQKPVERRVVPSVATQAASRSSRPLDAVGQEAVAQINSWYSRQDATCGGAALPAFLCSGVMLRATETNPAFLPWDPSPGSVTRGGVSFSWLRTDTNFANLVFAYRNGFIFYPQQATPPGKDGIQVLCIFPMDGDTGSRPALQGCGPNTASPTTSGPCESQNINTAAQWLIHFNQQANKYNGQCGWSVRYGEADTADRFYQAILARQRMPLPWWNVQDELMLATWPQGRGATLPIRAFFYVPGEAGALDKAKSDQSRYRAAYGIDMPIVRMTLPTSIAGKAVFSYSDADQGGGTEPPLPGTGFDFEKVALQGPVAKMDLRAIGGPFIFETSGKARLYIRNGSSGSISGHHLYVDATADAAPLIELYKPSSHVTFSYAKDSPGVTVAIYCRTADLTVVGATMSESDGRATCVGSGLVFTVIGFAATGTGVSIDNITTE